MPNNPFRISKFYKIHKFLFYFWVAGLAYIVFGGVLGSILGSTGQLGPHCYDTLKNVEPNPGTYASCRPCEIHWEIWGLIVISNCDNQLLTILVEIFLVIPRIAVIVLGLLVYTFVEPLRGWAPILFLVPVGLTFFCNPAVSFKR